MKTNEYDDDCAVLFTDGWIERELRRRRENPKAVYRRHYTDTRVMGLMAWFYKNNRDVSLALRMRVKRDGCESKRVYDVIGNWVGQKGALNVERARKEANFLRSKYDLEGFSETKECPLLDAAISCEEEGKEGYEQMRARCDPRTSRDESGLPKEWRTHINRFRDIYADFLDQPVSALTTNTLLRARDKYVAARLPAGANEKAVKDELKKLRSCYVAVMPMLTMWFRDTWGWIARDQKVERVKPKGYKDSKRYVYPGEWQASQDALDALEAKVPGAGLFPRFVFASGARTNATLLMKWKNIMSWGRPEAFTDFDGVEQPCVIWLPPPETMKARGGEDDDEKPCKLLVTGMALDILKRLRVIYENHQRENPLSTYEGVFPQECVALWQHRRSAVQRAIEKQAGTGRWHRKALRHSHGTYLEFIHCPMALITMTLTHTPSMAGVAPSTGVYTNASRMARFMKNEPLAALGPWHIRLHQLIRDMEEGNDQSPELVAISEAIALDTAQLPTQTKYKINPQHVSVVPRVKVPRLSVVK